ncbi:DNA sulfur modification protein DndD [Gloeothece citriformis PCC 7424]|uniref:Nuclease SbcCD subunit C n=1 Tax=Gloeothece citriformis (strain PCC 7424) TaxID=65393 RepID=B7KE81_GLOC7|nr:DNA sulfur modification protein DndD [Gloeothece citriformis]ACK73199.1 DNA sulfur modification protein DndD [Gloeothece citriformis PCC 7424]
MIFTELILENFGPYAGKHIINLRPEIEENTRPIILFGGMNGGGKTTLMDAIRLALYGSRAQCSTRGNLGYSDFLTQSVNSQTPPYEKARIYLSFELFQEDELVEITVNRYWERNPVEGKDHLGIIRTVSGQESLDTGLANTWDEYIETLLPLGISNLFLFDGEQVKELAEQDIPPQPVIEAIQSLLGLGLAEKLAIDLEVLVSRKRKQVAKGLQLDNLEKIEAKLKQHYQEEELAKEELGKLTNHLKRAQNKEKLAEEKFRVEGGKIAAKKTKLDLEKKDLETSLDTLRKNLTQLAAGVLPLGLITPLLQQVQNLGEQDLKSQQFKMAQSILKERDERLLSYLNQLNLKSDNLEKINNFLSQENQQLTEEYGIESWLNLNEEDLKQLNDLLNLQLPLQLNLAQEQLSRLHHLETELESKEKELVLSASPEDYDKLDKALQEAKQEVRKCQTAYDLCNHRCQEIQKAIKKTKQELEKYSQDALDYKNDEHLIKSAARVQETLKLFKERLTLKKLNKLEGEVTECFRYLLHKSDLVHRVAIDTQNFSLSLYDPTGKVIPKHRLSAGEKQLLAIAFLWGLARVSGRNLPVAIDTPLGRLDSSHRNNLVERYFPTASHQVILLSTDTEIGKTEVQKLREIDAIAKEYLLKYDSSQRQTTVHPNSYFWPTEKE